MLQSDPYTECIQHRLEHRIRSHGEIHRSLEFAFDPGDLVRNLSKVIPRVPDQGVDGSVSEAGEAESDSR